MLAPMRTQQLRPNCWEMRVEIMHGPSILTSIPLMREIASTFPLIFPTSLLQIPSMNWCGVTNTNMFASFTATPPKKKKKKFLGFWPIYKFIIEFVLESGVPAFSRSGSATTFLPSFIPGRYLTFSCLNETGKRNINITIYMYNWILQYIIVIRNVVMVNS